MERRRLSPGDILEVTRPPTYSQHFAVYIGDNKVVHYASPSSELEGVSIIHEASLDSFLRNAEEFQIIEFNEARIEPKRYRGYSEVQDVQCFHYVFPLRRLESMFRGMVYHMYTPEETVQRALKMAKDSKNEFMKLVMMSSMPLDAMDHGAYSYNHEFFPIWCKIGVKDSKQISRIVDIMMPDEVLMESVMV